MSTPAPDTAVTLDGLRGVRPRSAAALVAAVLPALVEPAHQAALALLARWSDTAVGADDTGRPRLTWARERERHGGEHDDEADHAEPCQRRGCAGDEQQQSDD